MSAHPNRLIDSPRLQAAIPADLPRLWPDLDPARRRQLAQWLAELSRRLHRTRPSAPEETGHERA